MLNYFTVNEDLKHKKHYLFVVVELLKIVVVQEAGPAVVADVVVEAVEEEVAAVAVELDVVVAGDDALGTSKISKEIKINYKANTFTTLKLDGLHRINHKALSTARNLFRALFFPSYYFLTNSSR